MLVRYFMTSTLFTIDPDMRCLDAYQALVKRGIRRAPVIDGGELVGIVTHTDLIRRLPGTVGQAATKAGEAGLDSSVRHVMAQKMVTVKPTDSLECAAQLMVKHRIGGIPVVKRGRLAGIITESDVFKGLCKLLSFGTGCRIVIEEPGSGEERKTDHVKLCLSHDCVLNGLLRLPLQKGASMVYLNVEGGDLESLLADIWNDANRVISVEEHPHRGPKTRQS